MDAVEVYICQVCGQPSTSRWRHRYGQEGEHVDEYCGRCGDVYEAIAFLGCPETATDVRLRRERVLRILGDVERADVVCDAAHGEERSRLGEWFGEGGGES